MERKSNLEPQQQYDFENKLKANSEINNENRISINRIGESPNIVNDNPQQPINNNNNNNQVLFLDPQNINNDLNQLEIQARWTSVRAYFMLSNFFDMIICKLYHSVMLMIIVQVEMLISALIMTLGITYLIVKLNDIINNSDQIILEINTLFGLLVISFHIYFIITAHLRNLLISKKLFVYLLLTFIFNLISEVSRKIATENSEHVCKSLLGFGILAYFLIFILISIFLIFPKIILIILFIIEFLIRLITCNLSNPCLYIQNQHYVREVRLEKEVYKGDKKEFLCTNCTICLEEIKVGNEICQLKCHEQHFFHYSCLENWSKKSDLCPNCRNPM